MTTYVLTCKNNTGYTTYYTITKGYNDFVLRNKNGEIVLRMKAKKDIIESVRGVFDKVESHKA